MDNGGYQIQEGLVALKDIPVLASYYYQTIKFTPARTFTLDIAPVRGFEVDEETMRVLSIDSCEKALALPAQARDRMHFVVHFKTSSLIRTARMLLKRGYADTFKCFATGGVASDAISRKSPIIGPVVPLLRVMEHAHSKGLQSVRYHIFGSAQPADILVLRGFVWGKRR